MYVRLAALAVALVLLGRDPSRLSVPFGPSHDGFNAALYMSGGRAILEEGLIASKFGATVRTLAGDRIVYAHHPPLVYLGDAAIAATLGPTEVAARLLAVLFSLLVLVQLVLAFEACGLQDGPAAIGLLVAFATPMFFLFGVTTEPHILGLAPITSLILLWTRARRGVSVPAWILFCVAAAATLTSWLAGLFAAVVALALLAVDRRRSAAIAILSGTAVPAILIGAWILWAYDGDPSDFVDRTIHRIGAGAVDRVTLWQAARRQMLYLNDLFPIGGWLVVGVAAAGLFDDRIRSVVAASLGTVLAYAALFKNGAYDHDYWLYCILVPVAFGAAASAEAAAGWVSRRVPIRFAPEMLGGGLVLVLTLALWQPSDEERQRVGAAEIGAQARALQWPEQQRYAYHAFGGLGATDLLPWLVFYSRREPFGVEGPHAVPRGEVMLRVRDGNLAFAPGEQVDEP